MFLHHESDSTRRKYITFQFVGRVKTTRVFSRTNSKPKTRIKSKCFAENEPFYSNAVLTVHNAVLKFVDAVYENGHGVSSRGGNSDFDVFHAYVDTTGICLRRNRSVHLESARQRRLGTGCAEGKT